MQTKNLELKSQYRSAYTCKLSGGRKEKNGITILSQTRQELPLGHFVTHMLSLVLIPVDLQINPSRAGYGLHCHLPCTADLC